MAEDPVILRAAGDQTTESIDSGEQEGYLARAGLGKM